MAAGLYLGAGQIKNVYLGSKKASKVYLGSNQIWTSSVTTTAVVAAAADDGYAQGSLLSTTIGFLVQANGSGYYGFARFAGLAVPQGATIDSATITVGSYFGTYGGADCTITAVAADNPATPSTAAVVTGAAQTASSVSWVNAGTLPTPATSPDLAAVVQEIVDRPGWASGNAIMFVANCPSGPTAFTRGNDKAETLTVTYS